MNVNELNILIDDLVKDEVRRTKHLAHVLSVVKDSALELAILADSESRTQISNFSVPRHERKNKRFWKSSRTYSDLNVKDLGKATKFAVDILECCYCQIIDHDHKRVHHPIFEYQNGRWHKVTPSWNNHLSRIKKINSKNPDFLLSIDVENFYGSLNLHAIDFFLSKEHLRASHSLREDVFNGFPLFENGLPLGYFFSDVLARIALSEIDRYLLEEGFEYSRFQDDFVIACSNRKQSTRVLNKIEDLLNPCLRISKQKSFLYSRTRCQFLPMGIQPLDYPLEDRISDFLTDDFVFDTGYDIKQGQGGNWYDFDHRRIYEELHRPGGRAPSSSLERFNLRAYSQQIQLSEVGTICKERPHTVPIFTKNFQIETDYRKVNNIVDAAATSESTLLDCLDFFHSKSISAACLRRRFQGNIWFKHAIARRRASDLFSSIDTYEQINFNYGDGMSLAERCAAIAYEKNLNGLKPQHAGCMDQASAIIFEALSTSP